MSAWDGGNALNSALCSDIPSKEPVQKVDGRSGQAWPGMATAAKAYGKIRSKVPGLQILNSEAEQNILPHSIGKQGPNTSAQP